MFKICSKYFGDMFKKKPTAEEYKAAQPQPATEYEKPGCRFCRAVKTAGRSGEKEVKFVDGDSATVEIINESHVEGRMCYTLNVMNDPEVGWNEIPIKYCPFCSRPLNRGRKKC